VSSANSVLKWVGVGSQFKRAGWVYYVPCSAYSVLVLIALDHLQGMVEFPWSSGGGRYKRRVPGMHFDLKAAKFKLKK